MRLYACRRFATFRTVAISILAAVTLGGCGAIGGNSPTTSLAAPDDSHLSPAERQLRAAVRQDRQAEAAGLGCVTGAGLGLATALLGGDTKHAIRNAVIGCFAGGVVGLAWGSYVDARAQTHANEQERVARLTAAAQQDVARYARVNAATQALIDEERRRITQASSKKGKAQLTLATHEATAAERAKTISLLEAQLQQIDGNVKTIEADQAELAAKGIDSAVLTAQRQALLAQQSQLSAKIGVLKSMPGKPA
jgi:hypothetical protein